VAAAAGVLHCRQWLLDGRTAVTADVRIAEVAALVGDPAWVRRLDGGRALKITEAGHRGLNDTFGVVI
jgi:hypothetical protein